MSQLIGFATEFYTLWSVTEEKRYKTDSYGTNWPCESIYYFHYHKNISKDINKVREKYPNLDIDEDLKGKCRDFCVNKAVDLPCNIFWFGKYYGKLIDEIIFSDFEYCLWVAENGNFNNSKYIKNTSVFKEYIEKLETEKQNKIKNASKCVIGKNEIEFTSNGKIDDSTNQCYSWATINDTELKVFHSNYKEVGGMYPYIMPFVNGKFQRTKGKKIIVDVTEAGELDENLFQIITIK